MEIFAELIKSLPLYMQFAFFLQLGNGILISFALVWNHRFYKKLAKS